MQDIAPIEKSSGKTVKLF